MKHESALRRVAVGALFTLVGGLAVGSAQAETLRFWTFLDPNGQTGRELALKQMIDGFQAAHPGVTIQTEPQAWRQMADKFLAASQTNTAPDVIMLNIRHLRIAVEAGTLARLEDLFMKDWTEADFADVDGPYFRFQADPDTHYQIAVSRGITGMCYRADLFEAAGIDPTTLDTWDEFIAAAQKVQETDASGNVTRWGFAISYSTDGASGNIGIGHLVKEQGSYLHEDGKANWATPAGAKIVKLLADFVSEYKITPPNSVSMTTDDVYDQFTSGRAAIARCPAVRAGTLGAMLGDTGTIGYMPTPSFNEGEHTPIEMGGWPIGVWTGSEHKELAGEFVEWLTSSDSDLLWVTIGEQNPIRLSTIANNPDLFEDPKNAYQSIVVADMNNNGIFPPDNAGAGWSEGINAAVQDILTNGTDPLQALKVQEEVYNRGNKLLN